LPRDGPLAYPILMRLFVYEYTCAMQSGDDPRAAALRTEGAAMLRAIVEDLAALREVELSVLAAPAIGDILACPQSQRVRHFVNPPENEDAAFRDLAQHADWTLVIAPEFDDLLFNRCRSVEQVGGRLLGPSSDAVRATSDKWALAQHWTAHGVPTPATALVGSASVRYPAVLKPRFGAGSLATFLIRHAGKLPICRTEAEQELWRGEMILQSHVRGRACSVSFLIGPAGSIALPACLQRLTSDGRFHYLGGSLPLPSALADRAVVLGRRAIASVVGLRGYVGVDLVLGHASDGGEDAVIEINPRITTSYIGLRALAETNLAEAMLLTAEGRSLPVLEWRTGAVLFHADGRIKWDPFALEC
jgi:tyramine---L-glutamate ligase